jgi:hypothetical protein
VDTALRHTRALSLGGTVLDLKGLEQISLGAVLHPHL